MERRWKKDKNKYWKRKNDKKQRKTSILSDKSKVEKNRVKKGCRENLETGKNGRNKWEEES